MKASQFLFTLPFLLTITVKAQDSILIVPENSLYYFYQLELEGLSISFPEKTKVFPEIYKSYYSKNETTPYITDSNHNSAVCDSKLADTIKSFINLNFIEDVDINNKIFYSNNLSSSIIKYLKKARSLNLRISLHWPNILKKLDSMNLFDQERVDSLVNANWPYEAIDGGSYYSPQKNNVVRFNLNTLTYQNNEACELTLFKDYNGILKKKIYVRFKSWMASDNPLDFYWVSENELVFKITPIRRFVAFYNSHLKHEELTYQTVKLTIVE